MQRKFSKKYLAMLVSLLLLATVTVGGTIAYIVTNTDAVTNTFTAPESEITVEEEFPDSQEKKDVDVRNDCDYPVYIRAKVIINWVDDDGNISPDKPVKDVDYEITKGYPASSKWLPTNQDTPIDGYLYYSELVPSGAETENLIDSCKPIKEKDGYHLRVEILAESIQSTPVDAVNDSWSDVTVQDGKLVVSTSSQTTGQ